MPRTVLKVGGSLFDRPDLAQRLEAFLTKLNEPELLLVPGGGPTTDVVRTFDQRFALGEEKSHWLALHALTLNAHLLAALLPNATVISDLSELHKAWQHGLRPILDLWTFVHRLEDAGSPSPPHCWDAGSDCVALVAAKAVGAARLILLKSTDFPPGLDWASASQQALVDPLFGTLVRGIAAGLQIEAIALR